MKPPLEIEDDILNGSHGIGVKLLFEYTRFTIPELEGLKSGYNEIASKFLALSERFVKKGSALKEIVYVKQEPSVVVFQAE